MNTTNVRGLIAILLDRTAPISDRDDAAMDLGNSDDKSAADALIAVGQDRRDHETVVASCGESLARIAVRTGHLDAELIERLAPIAVNELLTTIRAMRPELLSR